MFACCGCAGDGNRKADANGARERRVELDQRVMEQPNAETDAADVRIEISDDNGDDEVFCEGTGPPVKLADNLGTPREGGRGVNRSLVF